MWNYFMRTVFIPNHPIDKVVKHIGIARGAFGLIPGPVRLGVTAALFLESCPGAVQGDEPRHSLHAVAYIASITIFKIF